jgi:hypothetical protein
MKGVDCLDWGEERDKMATMLSTRARSNELDALRTKMFRLCSSLLEEMKKKWEPLSSTAIINGAFDFDHTDFKIPKDIRNDQKKLDTYLAEHLVHLKVSSAQHSTKSVSGQIEDMIPPFKVVHAIWGPKRLDTLLIVAPPGSGKSCLIQSLVAKFVGRGVEDDDDDVVVGDDNSDQHGPDYVVFVVSAQDTGLSEILKQDCPVLYEGSQYPERKSLPMRYFSSVFRPQNPDVCKVPEESNWLMFYNPCSDTAINTKSQCRPDGGQVGHQNTCIRTLSLDSFSRILSSWKYRFTQTQSNTGMARSPVDMRSVVILDEAHLLFATHIWDIEKNKRRKTVRGWGGRAYIVANELLSRNPARGVGPGYLALLTATPFPLESMVRILTPSAIYGKYDFTDPSSSIVEEMPEIRINVPWDGGVTTMSVRDVMSELRRFERIPTGRGDYTFETASLPFGTDHDALKRVSDILRLEGEVIERYIGIPLKLTPMGMMKLREACACRVFHMDDRGNPNEYAKLSVCLVSCTHVFYLSMLQHRRAGRRKRMVVRDENVQTSSSRSWEWARSKTGRLLPRIVKTSSRMQNTSPGDLSELYSNEWKARNEKLTWRTFCSFGSLAELNRMYDAHVKSGKPFDGIYDDKKIADILRVHAPIWAQVREDLSRSRASVYSMKRDGTYETTTSWIRLKGKTFIYVGAGENDGESDKHVELLAWYLKSACDERGRLLWKLNGTGSDKLPNIYTILSKDGQKEFTTTLKNFGDENMKREDGLAASGPVLIVARNRTTSMNVPHVSTMIAIGLPRDYNDISQLWPGRCWRRGAARRSADGRLEPLVALRYEIGTKCAKLHPGPMAVAYTYAMGQVNRDMERCIRESGVGRELFSRYSTACLPYLIPEVGEYAASAA